MPSKAYQLKPVPLGQVSFVAGGNATLKFDRAMTQMQGRLAHIRKIQLLCRPTPTLSSGNATPAEMQKAVKTLIIKDSVRKLFEGSFTSLRHFEMYENGSLTIPEPDALLTTEAGCFTRTFDLALKSFGNPDDFLQPLATFGTGSIYFGFGALLDIDANCTAFTMTIDVIAWVAIADDILMPPLLERGEQDIQKSIGLDAEALYAFLAFADSNAFGAITNGDMVDCQITDEAMTGEAVIVSALRDAYYEDFDVGQLSQVAGEPIAATDDNAKTITGTAAAAPLANLQPVIWSPPGTVVSKLSYSARPKISAKWSGTQSTFYALYSRLLPRTTDLYGKYLAAIRQFLPVDPTTWQLKPRTASKRDYVGPRREYLGVKLKAPRSKVG